MSKWNDLPPDILSIAQNPPPMKSHHYQKPKDKLRFKLFRTDQRGALPFEIWSIVHTGINATIDNQIIGVWLPYFTKPETTNEIFFR